MIPLQLSLNMRNSAIGLALIFLFVLPSGAIAGEKSKAPTEVNGFKLGESIEKYDFLSSRHYLKEIVIDDIGGFRRGTIAYGMCEHPGEILRIKLKYKDHSRQFYQELLKRFKAKFGKPDEFTGDAFGIVLAWKWRFTDENNNYISLTLQHNQKNLQESVGNMIKLSMPDRIEAERKCFAKSCAENKINCPISMMSADWDNLIPR